MDLSIIIPNFNTKKLTSQCIESIIDKTKKINYEIIVIDNNSTDKSVKYLKSKFGNSIKLIVNDKNVGFGGANNIGMRKAKGDYVLLLNSDTKITHDIFQFIIEWMNENKGVGILSCKLLNSDGTVQANGGYFPTLVRVFSWMFIQDIPYVDNFIKPFHPMKERSFTKASEFYEEEKDLDWVSGSFMFMSNNTVHKVGEFDTEYFMYTEEVDYCMRAKKHNIRIYYNPIWSIIHFGGASSTKEFPIINEIKGVKRFYKKHYPAWQYPFLRMFLKIGMFGRMILFGILEGAEPFKTYAKAFKIS